MNGWRVFKQALIETLRLWPVIAVLWGLNLGCSLIAQQPLTRHLFGALSHSTWGERLDGFVSSQVAADQLHLIQESVSSWLPGVLFLALLTGIWQMVALGGILGRLDASRRGGDGYTPLAGFLADCGRFVWRSVRLTLWSILLTGSVVSLLGGGFLAIKRVTQDDLYQSPRLLMLFGLFVVGVFLLIVVRAMVDSARADLLLEERTATRRCLWEGITLVIRHPRVSLGTYCLTGGLLLTVAGVMAYVRLKIPELTLAGVFGAFFLTQVTIYLRMSALVATSAVALMARGELDTSTPKIDPRLHSSLWGIQIAQSSKNSPVSGDDRGRNHS